MPDTVDELYNTILSVDFDLVITDLCNPRNRLVPNISFLDAFHYYHRQKKLIYWGDSPTLLHSCPKELMKGVCFINKNSRLEQLRQNFSDIFLHDAADFTNPLPFTVRGHLTRREMAVISNLVQGRSVTDVASMLFISAKTVNVHKRNAMKKLGVRSLGDLISRR
ncbi:response regulator transcription factor [Erwinia sp. HR93]|uniref:response regulator transcription factor n=1 Tax=Erwinia sp. HR93 TaxID=3094840 RepID=UPI002ADECD9C|nr:LuxR C-terminal-related transcriptional regulator [Erwinia sp. HR93]MEA1063008.1 LuxR C-terminal-related transcriptional regulator [Erwinia sp. HR93]